MRYDEAKIFFRAELEKKFFRGYELVEVIHGIGTYTLRKMILDEIHQLDYVNIIDSHNPGSLLLELLVPEKSALRKYTS
jgi:hypothetical protein